MLPGEKSHFSKIGYFLGFWGHFWHGQNRGISRISKLNQYFDSHSRTKKASTFVEVSIESSENRAFDRALNEEASYFRSEMAEGILLKKWLKIYLRASKIHDLAAPFRPFSAEKWVCPPPPKVVFLGPKLSLKNVTFAIYGPASDGIFMGVKTHYVPKIASTCRKSGGDS